MVRIVVATAPISNFVQYCNLSGCSEPNHHYPHLGLANEALPYLGELSFRHDEVSRSDGCQNQPAYCCHHWLQVLGVELPHPLLGLFQLTGVMDLEVVGHVVVGCNGCLLIRAQLLEEFLLLRLRHVRHLHRVRVVLLQHRDRGHEGR